MNRRLLPICLATCLAACIALAVSRVAAAADPPPHLQARRKVARRRTARRLGQQARFKLPAIERQTGRKFWSKKPRETNRRLKNRTEKPARATKSSGEKEVAIARSARRSSWNDSLIGRRRHRQPGRRDREIRWPASSSTMRQVQQRLAESKSD